MAKLLNPRHPLASKFFVSCVDLATRALVFDVEAPQQLKERVFILNESLREYELMDQFELIEQLKLNRGTRDKDIPELTWIDYLQQIGDVFTYHLSLGGMYQFTESFDDISSQVSDILRMLC